MYHTASASHDERARWQAVLSAFKHAIEPMKCAPDVEIAQQHVIDIATQLMREHIAEWNRTTITCRLPLEVLAACFSFLSLEDLLPTTHVCRRWRSTALSCPELWKSLVFDSPHMKLDVVRMAIERSGRFSLDLEFLGGTGTAGLIDYLGCQMHRIRRLAWSARRAEFLLKPAPLLESLELRTLHPIPEAVLGGVPGRLHTLNLCPLSLPPRCPALSNVTSLSAELARHDTSGSLANLFSVCPRLQFLELNGLADGHYPQLSSGTPTRLQSLTLRSTGVYACDVMVYVHAWAHASPSLSRIHLHMEVSPANAAPMFAGVETLSVTQRAGRGSSVIETTTADGRQFTLVRRQPWSTNVNYDVLSATLADIIRPHRALLGALRVLRAPVTVLALLLLTPAPALPALRLLTVFVQMWIPQDQSVIDNIMYGDPDPVFPASQLAFLKTLGHAPLARIIVVVSNTQGLLIDEEHVRDVLKTLAESLPSRDQQDIVDVVLEGLQDAARLTADALPDVHGYRMVLQEDEKTRRQDVVAGDCA